MLNIKAINEYYQNTIYNEGLSENAREKWAKPIDRDAALNFGTREEYLQWVREWKAEYKVLSLEIRAAKRDRKTSSPTYRPGALHESWYGRYEANARLFARKQGKIRSQELRRLRFEIEKAG